MLAFRDRCLTSPRFIRLAEKFPLTRPIARREAAALFDLCAGFVYSQVLLACVRLRLFDLLREGPLSAEEIAHRLDLGVDATTRLLTAAVALRLTERRGSRYGLGGLGAAVLASPGLAAMVEHHALLYRDLDDPVQLLRDKTRTPQPHPLVDAAALSGKLAEASMRVRGGLVRATELSSYWPYAEGATSASAGEVSDYSALMASTQPAIATEILDAYDLKRHRCLMDVGGGDGTFLLEAAERAPDLRLILFDVPAVAALAGAKFQQAGINGRASAIGGSFLGNLPQGADVITLVRVLLDHDDETVLTILKSVRAALPRGGVLLVAEPLAGTRHAEKVAAYFSFYLMAMGHGRPRTSEQLQVLMRKAGFPKIRSLVTCQPLLTSLLAASV